MYDPVDLATMRSQESPTTLPPVLRESHDPDDVFLIAHTSGSTSGKPKLVRCTFRWMDASYQKASHWKTGGEPDVQNWL